MINRDRINNGRYVVMKGDYAIFMFILYTAWAATINTIKIEFRIGRMFFKYGRMIINKIKNIVDIPRATKPHMSISLMKIIDEDNKVLSIKTIK